MNSSTYTIDLIDREQTSQAPATNSLRESNEPQSEKGFGFFRIAKVAGVAISLAVSPVTTITDPWWTEIMRRDAAVTASIYQEALGRFISRVEALRIARQILEHAEQERLVFAESEAAKGVQWENIHDL